MNNISAVMKVNSAMCVRHTASKWIATFADLIMTKIARSNTNDKFSNANRLLRVQLNGSNLFWR